MRYTKEQIQEQIDLILQSNKYSLEEYCKKVQSYKPKDYTKARWRKSIINSDNYKYNGNLYNLYLELEKLIQNDLLPDLDGFIGIKSILESSMYRHEDYIRQNSNIECYAISEKNKKKIVNINTVDIISSFQESEVLITSTKISGHYYILYHDDDIPTIISVTDSNFIKAMCSLSLMTNLKVFKDVLPLLPKFSPEFDLNDSLETLSRIVFAGDWVVDSVKVSKSKFDELNDFYWDLRENK
jgi:hypothetical protein